MRSKGWSLKEAWRPVGGDGYPDNADVIAGVVRGREGDVQDLAACSRTWTS